MSTSTTFVNDATHTPNPTSDRQFVDAQPILPRDASNVWETTEQARTALLQRFEEGCHDNGMKALVLQSDPYVHPAWVKFESWVPQGESSITKRASLLVTITAMPYHAYEAVYKADWEYEGRKGTIDHLYKFGTTEAKAVLDYLCCGAGRTPTSYLKRVQFRQQAWQLWKPTNRIAALRHDWLRSGSLAALLLGGVTAFGAWGASSGAPVDLASSFAASDTAAAGTIEFGSTVTGALNGGVDRYNFSVPAETSVQVDLQSAAFDSYLDVLDENGSAVLASDDDNGGDRNARIVTVFPAGRYVLQVKSLGAGGPYALSAMEPGSTPAPPPAMDSSALASDTPATASFASGATDAPAGATTFLVGALLALGGLVGLIVWRRAPRLVRSAGKPVADPRILLYLDSWQTVIFGAGKDAEEVKRRLMTLLKAPDQGRFKCSSEHIWHWGIDGKVEREQLVLRYGRALVFCQLYSYGSDLYVGWGAHMNTGTWLEKQLAEGIDRKAGKRVRLMTVERAVQPTSEYDLVDLNCLTEWTHAQVTQVVRHYVKEREIDQEIDYFIIRGERQSMTQGEKKTEKRAPRFRRTA